VIWLNPLAWLGLIVLVAPILIHILVHRRAERFAFPTLRFVQPTRLAAIRRHVLENLPLLIVRAGILAAAVGALAGPLLLTSARRQAWNARTVRATVEDRGVVGAELAPHSEVDQDRSLPVFRSQTFETPDLRDGVRRATAWLATAPPARRELLISASLAMGSISQADLRAVPPDVGIRFVRSRMLPATRSFAGAPVLSADPQWSMGAEVLERTIDLAGASTSVRDSSREPAMVPVEIVAPPEGRKAAEAALTAVLSQRVFAPLPGRSARVVFAGPPQFDRAATPAAPTEPWLADAIARIARDEDLQAVNADGTSSIAATSDGPVLVVRTSAPATSIATLRLLRTVLNALANPTGTVSRPSPTTAAQSPTTAAQSPTTGAPAPIVADALQSTVEGDTLQGVPIEILPIPDAQLHAWERPAGEVRTPRLEALEHDDRRWWWAAALLLLVVETRMRRTRADRVDYARTEEAARVA
jgi:hypothetical protein